MTTGFDDSGVLLDNEIRLETPFAFGGIVFGGDILRLLIIAVLVKVKHKYY